MVSIINILSEFIEDLDLGDGGVFSIDYRSESGLKFCYDNFKYYVPKKHKKTSFSLVTKPLMALETNQLGLYVFREDKSSFQASLFDVSDPDFFEKLKDEIDLWINYDWGTQSTNVYPSPARTNKWYNPSSPL